MLILLLYVLVTPRSDFATQTVILPGSIVLPLKRTQIGKVIGTAFGNGSDVVNLPSVLAISVAIETPTDPCTTLVFAPNCRVVVRDNLCLLPDSKLSLVAKICSMACQEAIRLAQRRPEVKPLKEFWYMEVPSCTEWAINSAMKLFTPNCYVEVGPDGVQAKVKALSMYRGVMRPYPHPRSEAYITGLAAYRGGQFQMEYAEAFEVVFRKY